jgi:[NiFe] hydrogenase assembly HybE family chaperone
MTFLASKLETIFSYIEVTRMAGIPVMNSAISVKAVDFQPWNNYQFGILITPWFMNLMLIPDKETEVDISHKVGSDHQHAFPSGSYNFVAGFEEEIGHYQSCSLFSPMFEFESQEAAEMTATEALKAIMDEGNVDASSQNPSDEIEQIWKGEKPQPNITHNFDGSEIPSAPEKEIIKPKKKLSEKLKEPTSRREFLRGKAFREEPGGNDLNKSNSQ